MARIKHSAGIEEMPGAHSKDGIVERRKIFRDYDGNVTKVGRLEAYVPNPRNFKTSPALIRERANMSQFGAASQFAKEFIDALKFMTPLSPEKQAMLDITRRVSMPNSKARRTLLRPKTRTVITSSMPA